MAERDEAAAAQDETEIPERMTGSGELPTLLITRDQVALSLGGKTRAISLEAILSAPQPDPLSMLLYGQLLLLRDCETSLRRLANAAEEGQKTAAAHASNPGSLISEVMAELGPRLAELGLELPGMPPAKPEGAG